MASIVKLNAIGLLGLAAVLSACQTAPEAERGPDKTVAHYVNVESSVPGVNIETNVKVTV
jgi:hypothetical protein